jgi:DNA-binding LytR/AlgR family response regulator
MFIKKGKSLKKVLIEDIIYIEVEERYCNIITEKKKFVIMMSLTKMLELHSSRFSRTHRNYVVNSGKIEEIIFNDNMVILKNHKVMISDTYKDLVKQFRILK